MENLQDVNVLPSQDIKKKSVYLGGDGYFDLAENRMKERLLKMQNDDSERELSFCARMSSRLSSVNSVV